MTNNEKTPSTSALKTMAEKLDKRSMGDRGYVTNLPELQAILAELSPLVSVNIIETRTVSRKDLSVEIRLGFTVGRGEL